MKKRKILIISHNPMNDSDNMGKTIKNIFSKFSDNELCQIFLKKQNIKSDNCNSFYSIDDISVLKSIIKRNMKTGKEIEKKEYIFEEVSKTEERIVRTRKNKNGLIYFARDVIWKLGKWKTKELRNWINKNKPTCIIYFAGDYTFSFDITIKLSKEFKIPFFIYFSDEYYRHIKDEGGILKIYKTMYRLKFKKAMKLCSGYFCITDAMEKYYESIFYKKGTVIMNTTKLEPLPKKLNKDSIVISYIGNLGLR